jgi:hypothetical protein
MLKNVSVKQWKIITNPTAPNLRNHVDYFKLIIRYLIKIRNISIFLKMIA